MCLTVLPLDDGRFVVTQTPDPRLSQETSHLLLGSRHCLFVEICNRTSPRSSLQPPPVHMAITEQDVGIAAGQTVYQVLQAFRSKGVKATGVLCRDMLLHTP